MIYARNNIRAGLWRDWQAAIFLRYLLIGMLALPTFFVGVSWLFVPVASWLLLMIARSVMALNRNRNSYPASLARNVARLSVLAPIIAAIDAAAFVGSIDWLVRDQLGFSKARGIDEPRG